MHIYRFFNRARDPAAAARPAAAGPGGGPPQPPAPVGAFITAETFDSFSVVTAFISTTYGVITLVAPAATSNKAAVLAVICLLVGAAIYVLNITDPQNPATPRQRIIGAFFAFANSIQLFAATYGVAVIASK
ncbi:MAG: hypothetical protein EKK41_20625 [Hyphomicrobiales bacterium]|nr:MAG: hypothetical protein EKK41_20625 [Hyphomicrobiales bacterium]